MRSNLYSYIYSPFIWAGAVVHLLTHSLIQSVGHFANYSKDIISSINILREGGGGGHFTGSGNIYILSTV